MIEVLGIKNAAKLVPIEDDATATDPVQENQNVLTNKPVKAFIEQDHQAHIAVHTSMLQNPKIMGLVGQTPQGQALVAAMMAHINEHLAYAYRKEVEQTVGLLLPTEEQEKNMAPEVAAQVAQLSAQASTRMTQQAQSMAAQQQAQRDGWVFPLSTCQAWPAAQPAWAPQLGARWAGCRGACLRSDRQN
jgi:hypothetical protein